MLQKITISHNLVSMKWFLIAITLFLYAFVSAPLDLAITRYFFKGGEFTNNTLFYYLYTYGERPSQIIAFAGLLFLRKNWQAALYLFLTLAIGAFAINELTLKNHWGRPRPKQVVEFGGKQQFRPFYSPNFFHQPEPSKSFPCGHCTAGFYFACFAFLGKRYGNRSLFWFGVALSASFGSLLGLARIAQGGHFFSDVLFGCLVMLATAWTLDYWLYHERAYKAAS